MIFSSASSNPPVNYRLFVSPSFWRYRWFFELKNFVRYIAAQAFSRFVLGSKTFRAPSRHYRTTAEWFENRKRTKGSADKTSDFETATYEMIYPAHEVELPTSWANPSELNRFLPSQASLMEAFVTTLPQGRVLGFNVIAPDGGLFWSKR